jgi:hypothetical protein
MAVPAKPEPNQSKAGIDLVRPEWQEPCRQAIKLYGHGYDRKAIAKALCGIMYPHCEAGDAYSSTRAVLRRWESKQWFRDMVWDAAVIELDMSTPEILRGVARKAKKGRVDAAKLALAITGRHNEKEQAVPAAVTINLNSIPRPARMIQEVSEEVAIESVEED